MEKRKFQAIVKFDGWEKTTNVECVFNNFGWFPPEYIKICAPMKLAMNFKNGEHKQDTTFIELMAEIVNFGPAGKNTPFIYRVVD